MLWPVLGGDDGLSPTASPAPAATGAVPPAKGVNKLTPLLFCAPCKPGGHRKTQSSTQWYVQQVKRQRMTDGIPLQSADCARAPPAHRPPPSCLPPPPALPLYLLPRSRLTSRVRSSWRSPNRRINAISIAIAITRIGRDKSADDSSGLFFNLIPAFQPASKPRASFAEPVRVMLWFSLFRLFVSFAIS